MSRSLFIAVAAAATLAACATTPPEPIIRTVEVQVPVSTSCVPSNLPPAPIYVDTNEALRRVSGAERFQLVVAGREQREARLNELETVIELCRKPPETRLDDLEPIASRE